MVNPKKKISVVTACYNEEENVEELFYEVQKIFEQLPQYDYEHWFIDNSSTDNTVSVLRRLAEDNKQLKLIVNSRNFGHIRSPYYALLQAKGDAVISLVADFQDPPQMIFEFVKKWEEGFKVVAAVKKESEESPIFFAVRKIYYMIVSKLADVRLIQNYTGFGLYDKQVMDTLRDINDVYPYFRGLISEIGLPTTTLLYSQPLRKRGFTKNNFYTLFDMAMLGITTHSKVPLRVATMLGFLISALSGLVAIGYFIFKLLYWDSFNFGLAPIIIGLFFFSSVQLFFIGIIGEYIGNIHTQTLKRPLVVEKERVNC